METGTKLVLFSVKIPFYQEDREDRDTAVPVTQCNELCIVTLIRHSRHVYSCVLARTHTSLRVLLTHNTIEQVGLQGGGGLPYQSMAHRCHTIVTVTVRRSPGHVTAGKGQPLRFR